MTISDEGQCAHPQRVPFPSLATPVVMLRRQLSFGLDHNSFECLSHPSFSHPQEEIIALLDQQFQVQHEI